jgi:hypothetical protein
MKDCGSSGGRNEAAGTTGTSADGAALRAAFAAGFFAGRCDFVALALREAALPFFGAFRFFAVAISLLLVTKLATSPEGLVADYFFFVAFLAAFFAPAFFAVLRTAFFLFAFAIRPPPLVGSRIERTVLSRHATVKR